MRDVVRAAAKIGVAVLANLAVWMVAGKVLALVLGPSGVGLFGLLRQLLQYLVVAATLNGPTVLIQGVAARRHAAQARFTRTAFQVQLLATAIVAVALIVSAPWIAPSMVPHPAAVSLVRWLSLGVVTTSAMTYFTGVLNGHRLVDALVRSQLLGPVVVLTLAFPMVWLVRAGQPLGFILLLAAPPAVVAGVATWQTRTARVLPSLRYRRVHRSDALAFVKTSLVMLATGLLVSGTQFLQGWLVARMLGLAHAGYYWVAWTLSMSYVTLALGSLGSYYLPSLSRLSDAGERRRLIASYLDLSLVAMPVLVSIVTVAKPLVVRLLFSSDLLQALVMMRWMLLGDFLKGVSWVLGFPMVAFGHMRWFLWTEVVSSVGLLAGSYAAVKLGTDIEGIGVAFALLYGAHLAAMVVYARAELGFRVSPAAWSRFACGLAIVLGIAVLTWNHRSLRLVPVLVATVVCAGYAFAVWRASPAFRRSVLQKSQGSA